MQQGLLLAIWRFAKGSIWNRVLYIYASVRSEAFGPGQDHPDIASAMALVMPLQYGHDALEGILNDRIAEADPERLAYPVKDGVRPIGALCGFTEVVHENRSGVDGGFFREDVFDAILRHTRLVPREVIAIGNAIYNIKGAKNFDSVRNAVNVQAGTNIEDAVGRSLIGWNDSLHGRFAASLPGEVIDGATMSALTQPFGLDGPGIVKFFVQHGLLGKGERMPNRHRHFYQQRFAFDEVHDSADAHSLGGDYFFIHPAFKGLVRSMPERGTVPFVHMPVGVIGNLKPFEAMAPLIRMGVAEGQLMLRLRNGRRLTTTKSARSNPLRFLFVVLWTCRERGQMLVDASELEAVWKVLRGMDETKAALTIPLPSQIDDVGEKFRWWQKRINRDGDIRRLQRGLETPNRPVGRTSPLRPKEPFISVSAKSSMGSQVEVSFSRFPLDELDWEEALHMKRKSTQG